MMDMSNTRTLGHVLTTAAARWPDKVAFETIDGKTVTFGVFNQRVNALNNAVATLGVKKGARIAILSKNRPEYIEVYGLSKSGYVVVPLNWRLAANELIKLLQHSQPDVIIVDASHLEVAQVLRSAVSCLTSCILLGNGEADGWLSYESLVSSGNTSEPSISAQDDDVLSIIYTSGTTGNPKGVAMLHSAALGHVEVASQQLQITDSDVTMAVMPLFHVGGMWYHLFPSFACGSTTLMLSDFEPGTVLRELESKRISNVHLVPTMIGALVDHPDAAKTDLSGLRSLFYAASSIPPSLLHKAMQTFPKCGFVQGYGSTEGGMISVLTALDHRRAMQQGQERMLTSCGMPYPKRQVRIVDDSGHQVPQGSVGEIEVRSPDLMKGYWLDESATDRVLKDGWLRTGDLGRQDTEGFIYLVDRKNDMVVTGGENVFPTEVEAYFFADPDVKDVAVFGIPDPRWVERVVAAVVRKPGSSVTAEELNLRVRKQLAAYKCPKQIFFVDQLPKNAVGKVLRKELRKQYGDESAKN